MPGKIQNSKRIRVHKDEYKKEIEKRFGNLLRASREMKRSHDYLGKVFRLFNVSFPEIYLLEIRDKLGVDYENFRKRNTPKYNDSQITFETLNYGGYEPPVPPNLELLEQEEQDDLATAIKSLATSIKELAVALQVLERRTV